MPLTRDHLDHMASHHHATGRRRRRAFKGPVILQGNCHRHVGTLVEFDPVTMQVVLSCHECDAFIADVATTGGASLPTWAPIACPKCGPATPVWPTYWFRTGLLELACFGCGNIFMAIPVHGDTEEN